MSSEPPPKTAAAPQARRRPFRDNPRGLILVVALLAGLLVVIFRAAGPISELPLGVFSEAVAYTLSGVCLVMIAAILFVLARNLFKLWVERRDALPFARFRTKLVLALLAMAFVPAVLVLLIGSQVIWSSAQRWFSAPVEDVLDAARSIANQYYTERRDAVVARADRIARAIAVTGQPVSPENAAALRSLLATDLSIARVGMTDLYRATIGPGGGLDAQWVVAVASPAMPPGVSQASADRLAARVIASGRADRFEEPLGDGRLIRAATPIQNAAGVVEGAVVVSEPLSGTITKPLRLATDAYEEYQQVRVMKGVVQGVYLSFFVAVTLLILVSATWLGLYVAKRITRPVQQLAEGARAIGAGRLDVHLQAETTDELGSLVEAFNMMAAELRTSQERLDQSRHALEQKNVEVDARRRYIETILERIATGVISLDADGRISTVNGAAARLLGLDDSAIGRPAAEVLGRVDLSPLLPVVEATARGETAGVVEETTLARDEREVHLAVAATSFSGEGGRREGAVIVFDDVTPLIRAQRVAAWRDVARRLAHEIKNPLTPIQLSAERLRRNFSTAPPKARQLIDECTTAIITEVESLKGLVDEFAQFARMRGPRAAPADLAALIEETSHLYDGVLQQGSLRLTCDLTPRLPLVRVDAEQMRQVFINLIDNAIEALGGPHAPARPSGDPATIVITAAGDAANGIVRVTIRDNGPGVPAADRDKLFMPYYSTKGRGSGLGLAIVRRIIAEHGGSIEVTDVEPSGAQFTIELPVG